MIEYDGFDLNVYTLHFDFINNGTLVIDEEYLPTVEVSVLKFDGDSLESSQLYFEWKLINYTEYEMLF